MLRLLLDQVCTLGLGIVYIFPGPVPCEFIWKVVGLVSIGLRVKEHASNSSNDVVLVVFDVLALRQGLHHPQSNDTLPRIRILILEREVY